MDCSKHLVDGVPTTENRYPSLNMGYGKLPACTRRKVVRIEVMEADIDCDESWNEMECSDNKIVNDHYYTLTGDPCTACYDKNNAISSLA